MLIDAKWVFKTGAGSEDLATSTTTAVVSDYIDTKVVSGYADGGADLIAVVRAKTTTAAAGASFTISIGDCDTYNGTYVSQAAKTVPLASVVAGTILAEIPIPKGIRQFVKLTVTPAASMTGALTVNAAVVTE